MTATHSARTAAETGGPGRSRGSVASIGNDERRSIERLTQDGWTELGDFLAPAECDDIAAACARRHWPAVSADVLAWIMDPRWGPIAIGFLGPDVRFLREQIVTKAPHGKATVPWHQDSGYSRVGGEFLTLFVALEDVTADNGCLALWPGSHRDGLIDHAQSGYFLEIPEPPTTGVIQVPQTQGTALAFSSFTQHYSGANYTHGARLVWMLQFFPANGVDPRTGRTPDGCPIVAEDGVWLERPHF